MILRRITQHVKDQNWFAVGLDFFIVVVGVGAALMGQQWLNNSQQRADLTKAEYVVTIDVLDDYFNAKERLSVAACRKTRTRELTKALLETGDNWAGMSQENDSASDAAFEQVIPTSRRVWGSNSWHAELQRGSFNTMDDDRRYALADLFAFTQSVGELEAKLYDAGMQLKVLNLPLTLSPSDRTHYLERLAYHDGLGSLLEGAAVQVIDLIEEIGLDRSHPELVATRGELIEENKVGPARFGDCYAPITSAFLNLSAAEE